MILQLLQLENSLRVLTLFSSQTRSYYVSSGELLQGEELYIFILKILSILMPINILEQRVVVFFCINICLIFKARDCDFGLITIFSHGICC